MEPRGLNNLLKAFKGLTRRPLKIFGLKLSEILCRNIVLKKIIEVKSDDL